MKTALLLSGHMRCWKECFPNTKKYILDRWNPDVFITTWDNEGYWVAPENDPNNKGIYEHSPLLDVNGVIDTYEPVSIRVLRQDKFDFSHWDKAFPKEYTGETRVKNIMSQFFMMKQSISNLENYPGWLRHYDLVIRMRPDLLFVQDLPELDPFKFHVIRHTNPQGLGVGDMFFASSPALLKDISSMIYDTDMLSEIVKEIGRFCPHMLVEYHLQKCLPTRHVVHDIPKMLMHTPKGQYQDITNANHRTQG